MDLLSQHMRLAGLSEDPDSKVNPRTPMVVPKQLRNPRPPCPITHCPQCSQQWRNISGVMRLSYIYRLILPDRHASQLLQSFVGNIEKDVDWLQQAIKSHGDRIISYWTRGSKARHDVLLTACPKLYPSAFPVQELGYGDLYVLQARRDHMNELLLPYFNLEDLAYDPHNFLRLLHYRTWHDFRAFAMLDKQQHKNGFDGGTLPLDYNKNCVQMSPGPNYGALVPFNQEQAHSWRIIGFPRARLIIEAQFRLYRKLRNVTERILQHQLTTGITGRYTSFVKNGCHLGSVSGRASYLDGPYLMPPSIDHQYFCELARSRVHEAEDHLWLLQTDPLYAQHVAETLKSSLAFKKLSGFDQMVYLYDQFVLFPRQRFRRWAYILEECEHLHNTFKRLRSSIHPTVTNPPAYDRALGCLHFIVQVTYDAMRKEIERAMTTCPSFQSHYSFRRGKDGRLNASIERAGKYITSNDDGTGAYYKKDRPFWCLGHLAWDPNEALSNDHAMLFRLLDYHITRSSAKEKERIDERLAYLLSEMAAMHELLSTLQLQRPVFNAASFSPGLLTKDETSRPFWGLLHWRHEKILKKNISRFKVALDELCNVQIPLARSEGSFLTGMIEAREKLIVLWSDVRKRVVKRIDREDIPVARQETELRIVSYHCAPEHLRQLGNERAQLHQLNTVRREEHARTNKAARPQNTQPPLQTHWGHDLSDSLQRPEKVNKSAKRDKARSAYSYEARESSSIQQSRPDEATTKVKVNVKASSRQILTQLFQQSHTVENTTHKVRWQDFMAAMTDAGFAATSRGGSAVGFEASGSNSKGSIVFHRPHPDPELSDIMLRSIGKRMHKWFGWTRESFVGVDGSET